MKAISILKPLEFSLETTGESWTQGSALKGLLIIKNQSESVQTLSDSLIALAYADIKKVHAKAQGCFKMAQTIEMKVNTINGHQTLEIPFEFALDPNTSVSDKKASFHLLYGKMEAPFHLQIPILPQPLYLEMLKLFENFFRFKIKEYKGTAKGVDYILTPPSSREFATVETLVLSFITEASGLKIDFTFNIKKIELVGTNTQVMKDTKLITKLLAPNEYMMGKTHLDQDKLLKIFEAILKEVKPRHLL
ncbi:MAG: hypothetical protein ACOYL6_18580 [Bacteriovoracaceae bacterium]